MNILTHSFEHNAVVRQVIGIINIKFHSPIYRSFIGPVTLIVIEELALRFCGSFLMVCTSRLEHVKRYLRMFHKDGKKTNLQGKKCSSLRKILTVDVTLCLVD